MSIVPSASREWSEVHEQMDVYKAGDMRIERPVSTVREQVFQAVRAAIVSGHFLPGQRLTEKLLIDATGASRTSIREALRDLENHHFIERTGTNAIRVVVLDEKALNNIFDVRSALEPLAVEFFVARASDAEIAKARSFVEHAGGSVEERLDGALDFDRLLLEAVGNGVLSEILENLHWRIHVVRRMTMSIPGRSAVAWEEMNDVTGAISERNGARARDLMRVHIESARAAALSVVHAMDTADDH
ncbi:GntR family transcriptional regulator [Nocardioides sp. KIGAM211]|uniref:GntR family transcriptional regulator n=1 Tax=Nocardioides luti TaxID=2761101 RepID=A0A7X0RIA3_9ACTN|nr:GntR family transcriptional regulator [Nocardioides luti]MBB6627559.1 GntR family transcriptional regulator [Nocardioides luti]